MITEGKMQYLYDDKGRRYLDVSPVFICLFMFLIPSGGGLHLQHGSEHFFVDTLPICYLCTTRLSFLGRPRWIWLTPLLIAWSVYLYPGLLSCDSCLCRHLRAL